MMQSPNAPRTQPLVESSPRITGPGGGHASPAAPTPSRAGWITHLRESVWAPIVLKAGGGMIALCALGLMGAASLHGRALGAPVAPVGTEWVAAGDVPAASGTQAPAASVEPVSAGAHAGPAPCVPCASATPGTSVTPTPGTGLLPDGRIVLNQANVEELQKLPGIGQRRAEAIVALRERLKKFRRASDLLRVRGIGPKSLKRLEPHFVLDAPSAPAALSPASAPATAPSAPAAPAASAPAPSASAIKP